MATTQQKIIFEQPLNESIRICLRLEHLFDQINQQAKNPNQHLNVALIALVRILEVIDRPDIKSKLTQTLTQQATTLAQLEQFPQVNSDRLSETLKNLDQLVEKLHNTHAKLAAELRNNEFLNQVRLQLASPGGACAYNTPAFHLWQHQSPEHCQQQLEQWLSELTLLRDTSQLILRLTRESTDPQPLIAHSGFHHQSLNPSLPCQMIRVLLDEDSVFPAMSVGKHRVNIRFLVPNYTEGGHSTQLQDNLEFELACCRL